MSYCKRLREAVSEQVASGYLGKPVFARLIVAVDADHGQLLPAAGEGVALAAELLWAQVRAVFAGGSVQNGHLSVQVELEGGRSALVAVATRRQESPRFDLLLVGSHGTLYHGNNGKALSQQLESVAHAEWFEVTAAGQQAEAALRESLGRGTPVPVGG